jgi:hypothetical protein
MALPDDLEWVETETQSWMMNVRAATGLSRGALTVEPPKE